MIPRMRAARWYNSRLLVVLLLLLVWPVGIYGLWKSYRFSWFAKLVLTIAPVFLLLAFAHGVPFSIPGHKTVPVRDTQPTVHTLGESGNQPLSGELSDARMAQRQFVIGFDVDASKKISEEDAGGHYRLCRYSANYGFDDSAPSSVSVSGGAESDSRTELSRAIFTHSAQSSLFSWRGVAAVVYVVFLILSCIVIPVAILEIMKSHSKGMFSRDLTIWAFLIVPIVSLTILFGYISGRKIIIDNATEKSLLVRIDGKEVAFLPPLTFVQERVVGSSLDVEVFENGHLLESGKLRLDADINRAAEPAMLGRGKYIYNIGAANTYSVGIVNYSR